MDGEISELPGICKTSHGLASGNTYEEALFHALCELVERDGTTLWSLLNVDQASHTCIAAEEFDDPAIDRLAAQIAEAGLRLALFDQTSDVGIPVIMAVIGPAGSDAAELEIAAGYGAHPVSHRAALRAITEAAQSRVTSIAASRDDIGRTSFRAQAAPRNRQLLDLPPRRSPPRGHAASMLPGLLDQMRESLAHTACRVATVSIAPRHLPFHVVKALSPDLEDRNANINWRPGWRCFDFLSAAA
jgi:ribosomal protein S12 methylthiotransferase accessory factor